MARKPNQKPLSKFISALFLMSLMQLSAARASQMIAPKSAKVNEEIKIAVANADSGKKLEITVSSRSLKEAIILHVPTTGAVVIKDLAAGHYLLGLREEGAKKYIEIAALRIMEVLK